MITDSKKYYYVLLQKHRLIVINGQLPIFWNKKVADTRAKLHRCDVVRLTGKNIEMLISESIK
jgi:hypothetical protein